GNSPKPARPWRRRSSGARRQPRRSRRRRRRTAPTDRMNASERSRGGPSRAADPLPPRGNLARRVRREGGEGGAEAARRVEPPRGDFLDRLVHLLDSQFRVPVLGVRFGLDPILGLLPGAGDLVATFMGLAVLTQARREGARAGTLAR